MEPSYQSKKKKAKKRAAKFAFAVLALAMANTRAVNAQNCWAGDTCGGQVSCYPIDTESYCDFNCDPTCQESWCQSTTYLCTSAYCTDYECVFIT